MHSWIATTPATARRRSESTVHPPRAGDALTRQSARNATFVVVGELLGHSQRGCVRSGLRLAAHELVTEFARSAPILLLDDVFSELDPDRSVALLRALPQGQALLTTAGVLPQGLEPDQVITVRDGKVVA